MVHQISPRSYFTSAEKLAFLWNDLLLGRGLQGSSTWVEYFILPMFLGPIGFAVQEFLRKRFRIEGIILNTAWAYVIAITVFTWFAATVNGIAQTEDWYFQTIVLADGSTMRIKGSNSSRWKSTGTLCVAHEVRAIFS